VEAGSICKGADGRSANLRSRAARQFYNKGSDALKRDWEKIGISLLPRRKSLLCGVRLSENIVDVELQKLNTMTSAGLL